MDDIGSAELKDYTKLTEMAAIFLWPHAGGVGSSYNRAVSSLSKETFQAKTFPLI